MFIVQHKYGWGKTLKGLWVFHPCPSGCWWNWRWVVKHMARLERGHSLQREGEIVKWLWKLTNCTGYSNSIYVCVGWFKGWLGSHSPMHTWVSKHNTEESYRYHVTSIRERPYIIFYYFFWRGAGCILKSNISLTGESFICTWLAGMLESSHPTLLLTQP